MGYKIYISTGETSGDIHGAGLAEALKEAVPDVEITGMGGDRMQKAGVDLFRRSRDYAVMGFFGVMANIIKFKKLLDDVVFHIRENKIDMVVLIDYSGFNLRLARAVRKMGIKVIYFVSPQVWAWRSGRVKMIKKYVDRVITIFPFETEFYGRFDIDVDYVGHPLVDRIPKYTDDRRRGISMEFRRKHGIDPGSPLLGLLPGSRKQELERMLPTMLRTAAELKKDIPNLSVAIALAPNLNIGSFRTDPAYGALRPIVVDNGTAAVLTSSDAILTSSGTATVEAALYEVPQVVMYKTGFLTYFIARSMVNVKYIAMVNLIAGKRLVPEFVQAQARPHKLKKELLPMLTDAGYRDDIRRSMAIIREKLRSDGSYAKAAAVIAGLAKSQKKVD
jgi:lipid-A-disaccharide synthase